MNEVKSIFKTITPYLIIGILLILLFNKCDPEPKPITDTTTVAIETNYKQIDSLNSINKANKSIIDSLKTLKPKVVIRYKTVYDSLLVIDSMCVRSLNILYNECQKVDSVNNGIITRQENHIMNDSHIIGELTDNISLKNTRINNDSLFINQQKELIKKGKLKTILGTAIGVIAGFGLGSLR